MDTARPEVVAEKVAEVINIPLEDKKPNIEKVEAAAKE